MVHGGEDVVKRKEVRRDLRAERPVLGVLQALSHHRVHAIERVRCRGAVTHDASHGIALVIGPELEQLPQHGARVGVRLH